MYPVIRIPMLHDIFWQMDKNKFHMEDDEVVSYYYDEEDEARGVVSTSSLKAILCLYSLKETLGKVSKD